MSEQRVCVNGCHSNRTLDDGTIKRTPRLATIGLLCEHCRDRLARWLAVTGIPEDYSRLGFVAHPGSIERAPGSKQGKRANAPAPVRVEVLDFVDGRLGWRSDGTTDRRGALGMVESWARLVREERRMVQPRSAATLMGECAFLSKHIDWMCEQRWIDEMYREIRTLAKDLSGVIGYPWPKPMDCPSCDAAIWLPMDGADVIRCGGCGAQWEKDKWLFLERVIEDEAVA